MLRQEKKSVCSRTPTFIHVFIKGFWLLLGVFFKRVEGGTMAYWMDSVIVTVDSGCNTYSSFC